VNFLSKFTGFFLYPGAAWEGQDCGKTGKHCGGNHSMELRTLAEQIQYLPATEEPLSADIGIVHGENVRLDF
jgi:hypothetical protein